MSQRMGGASDDDMTDAELGAAIKAARDVLDANDAAVVQRMVARLRRGAAGYEPRTPTVELVPLARGALPVRATTPVYAAMARWPANNDARRTNLQHLAGAVRRAAKQGGHGPWFLTAHAIDGTERRVVATVQRVRSQPCVLVVPDAIDPSWGASAVWEG